MKEEPDVPPYANALWMIVLVLLVGAVTMIAVAWLRSGPIGIRAQRGGTICFALATALVFVRWAARTVSGR
jgi:hypothetical protein